MPQACNHLNQALKRRSWKEPKGMTSSEAVPIMLRTAAAHTALQHL